MQLIAEDPKVRKALYYLMVLLGVAALALKPINATASQTVQDIGTYLATLLGLVAASNVGKPLPPAPPKE